MDSSFSGEKKEGHLLYLPLLPKERLGLFQDEERKLANSTLLAVAVEAALVVALVVALAIRILAGLTNVRPCEVNVVLSLAFVGIVITMIETFVMVVSIPEAHSIKKDLVGSYNWLRRGTGSVCFLILHSNSEINYLSHYILAQLFSKKIIICIFAHNKPLI